MNDTRDTRFSMEKFEEAPILPIDEAPDCGGVNPPDIQGTSAGWEPPVESHGLTAEMDTWTETYMPDTDAIGMSDVPAMS